MIVCNVTDEAFRHDETDKGKQAAKSAVKRVAAPPKFGGRGGKAENFFTRSVHLINVEVVGGNPEQKRQRSFPVDRD